MGPRAVTGVTGSGGGCVWDDRQGGDMADQMPNGSAPARLTLDELDALIAASQKQLAAVNELVMNL